MVGVWTSGGGWFFFVFFFDGRDVEIFEKIKGYIR